MKLAQQLARLALGLFIVWQLLFLPAINFLGMLEQARPHFAGQPIVEQLAPGWVDGSGALYEGTQGISHGLNRWAELTGQPQNWSLFAPNVGADVVFVAVKFRWDDGRSSERSLSPNEPADLLRYFRMGRFRLRRYESSIDLYPPTTSDKGSENLVVQWRDQIESRVQSVGGAMHAYLRWRLEEFRRDRPDMPPPEEVVLLVRWYRIPEPGADPWRWQGPEERPVARWRPATRPEPFSVPVERFDPLLGRFEPVRRRG